MIKRRMGGYFTVEAALIFTNGNTVHDNYAFCRVLCI